MCADRMGFRRIKTHATDFESIACYEDGVCKVNNG